ncbi:MAG: bifunctional phosphopantothenoylcysteine decarboxylase/phosphopantothenate--cysteine ligase CoaBC [Candidatus Heteroscillospira sp.]|jgi:phosphopantothenoylcysteine decarboxylase/phosphopantothenate--cysteine ligase
MLKGKTLLLGVTGGIACYKSVALVSALTKLRCNVQVVMTENATRFISPLLFEQFTGNRTAVDTFDRNHSYKVEHIALAEQADMVLIAPATANILAKLAHGLADDMLSTTVLACRCPKYAAPAMNTGMYENPVTQDNLAALSKYGWNIIFPASGRLLCGAVGAGKMPEPEELLEYVVHELGHEKDMEGLRVLVTAGPTREALDPVRFMTNHSSGKMGYAIARAAAMRGARVTLVSGPTELTRPAFCEFVPVTTAQDMFEAVTGRGGEQDIIIKAAAVADYRPAVVAGDKIKKSGTDDDLCLRLERTQDILAWLGGHKKPGQFLCGFSMETRDMLENSRKKLKKKNLDMIAANNLRDAGAGFGVETNVLTLITPDTETALPLMSKDEAAHALLDEILKRR